MEITSTYYMDAISMLISFFIEYKFDFFEEYHLVISHSHGKSPK